MARITPLDLRKQEFKQSALGLNREQVHDFLEAVAEEMETLIREKNELSDQMKELKSELDKYKDIEKSMNSALVMAKESASQAVKAAEKEASAVLDQARTEKNAMLFSAKEQLSEIQNEIRDLKLKRDEFMMNFRTILKTHQDALEAEFSRDAVMNIDVDKPKSKKSEPTIDTEPEERIIDFSKTDLTMADLSDTDKDEPENEAVKTEEPEATSDERTDETEDTSSAFEDALDAEIKPKPNKSEDEQE